jgi:peptide subunit release factor RF-3
MPLILHTLNNFNVWGSIPFAQSITITALSTAKEPFELLEEIEETLNIDTYPMNWPIGMGQNFFGIIDRETKTIEPFRDEENILHLNDE